MFALGALDDSERRDVDAHLDECLGCRVEAERLKETVAALLVGRDAVDDVWARILAGLRQRSPKGHLDSEGLERGHGAISASGGTGPSFDPRPRSRVW